MTSDLFGKLRAAEHGETVKLTDKPNPFLAKVKAQPEPETKTKKERQAENLAKARATRITNKQEATWKKIEPLISIHRCKCSLQPGMKSPELQAMGAGCKDPYYCCPVLDIYRREVSN